jgi:hypothetical protein
MFVTIVCSLGVVWGGFLTLLFIAVRKEHSKVQ